MKSWSRQDLESIECMDEHELAGLVASLPAHDGAFERCAIINARCGRCTEDCRFCGQSVLSGSLVAGWNLVSAEEVSAAARDARAWGVEYFGIVISGRGPEEGDVPRLVEMIRAMVSTGDMPRPCLSPGICSRDTLRLFREAGLVRLHHNLETSENFFHNICSTHSWQERYETLLAAREVGLEICCGGLFGLGESFRDRVDLAVTLAKLSPESVPVNLYTPVPGSRMEGLTPLTSREILRILVMLRAALPGSMIRLCGGRALLGDVLPAALTDVGVSGLMTGNYLLTRGSTYESDVEMLARLGLLV